jgi:hypothetical protein
MCDIEQEREKIDTMILEAISPFRYTGPWNEAALTECAVASLADHFLDLCTESRLRARCQAFVARLFGPGLAQPAE